MTIQEHIAALQALNEPDTRVLVKAWPDGYVEAIELTVQNTETVDNNTKIRSVLITGIE